MKTLAFPLFGLLVLSVLLARHALAASVWESEPGSVLTLEMPLTNPGPAQEVGRICLAPRVHPAPISPADVGGEFDENSVEAVSPSGNVDLGVQETVEAGAEPPPVMVSQPLFLEADKNGRVLAELDHAVSLGPLSLDEEHLVKVREYDKIVQAFLVSFAGANPREVCVFYHEAKQAWVVVPMDEVATWCTCDHSAYVPPPSEEEQLELENQTDETDRAPADSKGETSR